MIVVKNIRILSQARDDLRCGKIFYDNIEKGIGDYFYDSLISDIESLTIYAGVHVSQFDYFKMNASRSPYFIYYKLEKGFAIVVAVLDSRQNPSKMKIRLF